MVRKLGAAEVHTADQKVQKDAGCIVPRSVGASSSHRELTLSALWSVRKSTEDARMGLCRTRDAAQFQEDRENTQCSKSIVSGTNIQRVTHLS